MFDELSSKSRHFSAGWLYCFHLQILTILCPTDHTDNFSDPPTKTPRGSRIQSFYIQLGIGQRLKDGSENLLCDSGLKLVGIIIGNNDNFNFNIKQTMKTLGFLLLYEVYQLFCCFTYNYPSHNTLKIVIKNSRILNANYLTNGI